MKRRGFLKGLLAGAAVLTTAQAGLVEGQLAALPALTPEAEDSWLTPPAIIAAVTTSLTWLRPVEPGNPLPSGCDEGDAVYVETSETVMVYVGGGVGWVELCDSFVLGAGTPVATVNFG